MAAGLAAIGGSILIAAAGCMPSDSSIHTSPGSQVEAESNAVKVEAAAVALEAQIQRVQSCIGELDASLARVEASVQASAAVNVEAKAVLAELNQENTIGGGDNNNVTTWLSLGLLGLIAIIQVFKPVWRWRRNRCRHNGGLR